MAACILAKRSISHGITCCTAACLHVNRWVPSFFDPGPFFSLLFSLIYILLRWSSVAVVGLSPALWFTLSSSHSSPQLSHPHCWGSTSTSTSSSEATAHKQSCMIWTSKANNVILFQAGVDKICTPSVIHESDFLSFWILWLIFQHGKRLEIWTIALWCYDLTNKQQNWPTVGYKCCKNSLNFSFRLHSGSIYSGCRAIKENAPLHIDRMKYFPQSSL